MGLVGSVDQVVMTELGARGKGLGTARALKWFLSRVYSKVFFQVSALCKPLYTTEIFEINTTKINLKTRTYIQSKMKFCYYRHIFQKREFGMIIHRYP